MDQTNAANGDDFTYGFRRPEMYNSPLSGTVDPYDRHVFLCYKTPNNWPANIEEDNNDPLPTLFSASLKSRKSQIPGKIRLTLCQGEDGGDSCNGDILIFPDMVRYRGLTHFEVDSFIDDVFVRGSKWALRVPESLNGSYIFVCSHQNRDKRCGHCGPVLVENFDKEITLRDLKNKVFVSPCSHLGGHQYAGNLIIFGQRLERTCEGHWYGYVTPSDVPCLLDEHIGKGRIVKELWRGQMSSLHNEVMKQEEKNPQGNKDSSVNRNLCCCSNDSSNCCANKAMEENAVEGKVKKNNTRQVPKLKGLGRL